MSDNLSLYPQLSEEEILANFGGHKRLNHLREFFNHLHALEVTLFVLSHGRKKAVDFFLRKANLHHHFREIICSDTPPMQAFRQEKGAVIMHYIQQSIESSLYYKSAEPMRRVQTVLFVDDAAKNLQVLVHLVKFPQEHTYHRHLTLSSNMHTKWLPTDGIRRFRTHLVARRSKGLSGGLTDCSACRQGTLALTACAPCQCPKCSTFCRCAVTDLRVNLPQSAASAPVHRCFRVILARHSRRDP